MAAIARNSPFTPRALAATIILPIAALAPARADDLDLWKRTNLQALILGPMRLNLGFADQAATTRVALVPSLSQPRFVM